MSHMRAKFQLQRVEKVIGGAEVLHFSAVGPKGSYPADGSDEDNTYAKWSPSASCSIHVTNPALHGKFEPGKKYYVDWTEASE